MTLRARSFIASIALAALSIPAVSQQRSSGLLPGDQIKISVWKNNDLSGEFTIAADGTIIHPLYRGIHVSGEPMNVIEQRLREFLSTYLTNPQIVVQPLVRVVVGGEVRNPNVFTVAPETTVMQAVALAGGPSERGRLDKVRLVRGKKDAMLDLTGGSLVDDQVQIQSGDEILVGRRRASWLPVFSSIASGVGALAALYTVLFR